MALAAVSDEIGDGLLLGRGLARDRASGIGDRGATAVISDGRGTSAAGHGDDRGSDIHRLALLDEDRRDCPHERRRKFNEGLRGLDLDQHLVDGDRVARLDLPGDDLGLGEALADVREQEF